MTENELSKIIVNACFQIHKELGPGLLNLSMRNAFILNSFIKDCMLNGKRNFLSFIKGLKWKLGFVLT